MAAAIVISTIIAVIAVGMGSYVLYPTLSYFAGSEFYANLLPQYRQGYDRTVLLASATPAILIGVIMVWAYMRAGRHDHT